MSITLMAYPMAFLIAPEKSKNEQLRIKIPAGDKNKIMADENLKAIKVMSNIAGSELEKLMEEIGVAFITASHFYINTTKLDIITENSGRYIIFTLSGTENATLLKNASEAFFADLDRITDRNVRLIGDKEIFYYYYTTGYKNIKEIYKNLKKEQAANIYTTEKNEVVADLKGQSLRYYKNEEEEFYTLEIEQKISIMNIGVNEEPVEEHVSYGLTNLKIKTNIKKEELKNLLNAINYGFDEENEQTPLRNSYAALNWVYKDGFYTAEFTGQNNTAIIKEAEIIFRKMNMAAKRDLRRVNEVTTTIYTYNTNYTDKAVLLNTLYEHGATEITENDEEISCRLFDMEMKYYKNDTGAFALDITQISDKSECEDLINDLNKEYGLNIQEITYNKIKERLQQENMRLESETVLDDNSIVLTIDI